MLKDSFNRIHDYLRISLTDKCNLRCTYCNPVDLPKGHYAHSNKMTVDEIDLIAGVFVQLGIKKIRLTGGEPLVRKGAGEIIQRLSRHPVELAITTNGVFVHEFIDVFQQAGMKSVNVSLDSLKKNKNALISGRNEFERVFGNVQLLLKNNFDVKVNTVLMKGVNDDEIPDFVEWTRHQPVHIRFIEFMPFAGNQWSKEKVFSQEEILNLIASHFDFNRLPDDDHGTAKKFAVNDAKGTFGIISTMSHPFCGSCNRLRLTTDGKMKNCLFSKGEADILGALRRGDDIVPLIKQCVWDKKKAQGGQFDSNYKNIDIAQLKNRSMIHIGG